MALNIPRIGEDLESLLSGAHSPSGRVDRLAVPFRDVNNLLPYVNRLWLYLSPIIYPAALVLDQATEPWATLYNLNPMVPILSVYRSALLGLPIDTTMIWASAIWAIGLGSIAVAMFVKYEGRMARYL